MGESELVIKPLSAHSQNQRRIWGLRLPTNFRHQICFVVHRRSKVQRTSSFGLYRSIIYSAPRASNLVDRLRPRRKSNQMKFRYERVREFCVIESCIVMHCGADQATDAPTASLLLQQVTVQRPNFEPGGREFEKTRQRFRRTKCARRVKTALRLF
jgi:hypothetical protein